MPQEITTSLGETRIVSKTYEDGSHECPWCYAAVVYPTPRCPNPACDTQLNANMLNDRRQKQAAQQQEEATRKRNHDLAMQRIEEDRIVREEARRQVMAESRTKLHASALRQVKTLLAYRHANKIAEGQAAYERLLKWCRNRNLDFNNVLKGATRELEPQSFKYEAR